MNKIILLVILIITTSFTSHDFDYNYQLEEIQQNLDEADSRLNIISVIISDPKRLKQIRKNIKNNN